ncbi:hypothetical protein VOLCADRAFT_87996 [Volvox carteri f. nagariensis]|uniref:Myb-like domain-containing protein n=1 Tax=Volvox carteri f. nagariensis TaxID=3068 RepID=D8TMT2_VOLCA|nr:uncharacterized protein VOLCADRAFT_87996 [Volvox carteri f. nagariensis]EFJ51307.1 hypothetical protein VOLCADRAFT_87996 [Volvox carteri f. nagariensis]|eukprot:XP_002947774.1 hypothetical protein VOLCADRAFT_87996 [Volvox carteri f. nagariensis]
MCRRQGPFEVYLGKEPSDHGSRTTALGQQRIGNKKHIPARPVPLFRGHTPSPAHKSWMVLSLYALSKIGPNQSARIFLPWSAIAKYLHGRSDNDCKNIFYSALRSKTSQTNRLLRTYAQAVGPNCDDPLARQNAYKTAKAQVAARNASLISRAAALAPRNRQNSRGGSASDDDSDIPADAAAAAAQAAAGLPQADAAAAAAAAAVAGADGGEAPEDIDPMDAGAYVSALQLQQATAAAAAAAAAGSSGSGGPQDPSPSSNSNRALIRRLSAQSGNRDSSMYGSGSGGGGGGGGGGGSPSIAPTFSQGTAAAAAATAAAGAPLARTKSQSFRDGASEGHPAGSGRQHQHQHQQPSQPQHLHQLVLPAWAASGRALLPPAAGHPLRQVRPRLMPFGPHPSPLSVGMAATSHDSLQLASPSAAVQNGGGAAADGVLAENYGASASSTESLQDATPPPAPPPLRRGSSGSAGIAAAAAAATGTGRKDRAARGRGDASSGIGSSNSSFGITVKIERSATAPAGPAAGTGSPNDQTAAMAAALHSSATAAIAAQGQVQHQPCAIRSFVVLDDRGGLNGGGFTPGNTCSTPGPYPQDLAMLQLAHASAASNTTDGGPTSPDLPPTTYYHPQPHPAYHALALSQGLCTTPGAAAAGTVLQQPTAGTPPPVARISIAAAGAPGMLFSGLPTSTCEELMSCGSVGPMGAPLAVPAVAASVPRWASPPLPAADPSGPCKYDMTPQPVMGSSGVLLYPSGGGWELSALELMAGSGGGAGGGGAGGGDGGAAAAAGGPFAVLPSPPVLLQQQHHQYHLGLQLQAQLQAQQQQLQEQQLQLQAQLAQLHALQRISHLHQGSEQLNSQSQGQGSPAWMASCDTPTPQSLQQQQQQPAGAAAAPPSSSSATATAPPGLRLGPDMTMQSPPPGRIVPETPLQPPPQAADSDLTDMWLSCMLE